MQKQATTPANILIEICSNCKSHEWCTRHNEQAYQNIANEVSKSIGDKIVDAQIRIVKVEGEKIGSFQIFCNDVGIFSKKALGYFPNAQAISNRISEFLQGKLNIQIRSPIKRRVDNGEFNSPVKKSAKFPPSKLISSAKTKKQETSKKVNPEPKIEVNRQQKKVIQINPLVVEAKNAQNKLQEKERKAQQQRIKVQQDKKKAQEEKLKSEEEKRKIQELKKKVQQEKIKSIQVRKAQQERIKAEEDKKKIEDENKKAQQKRSAEQEKKKAEEERIKAVEEEKKKIQEDKRKEQEEKLKIQEDKKKEQEERLKIQEDKKKEQEERLKIQEDKKKEQEEIKQAQQKRLRAQEDKKKEDQQERKRTQEKAQEKKKELDQRKKAQEEIRQAYQKKLLQEQKREKQQRQRLRQISQQVLIKEQKAKPMETAAKNQAKQKHIRQQKVEVNIEQDGKKKSTVIEYKDFQKQINRMFEKMDLDGNKLIDPHQFKQMSHLFLRQLELDITQDTKQFFDKYFIQLADKDNDGKISYEEFKKICWECLGHNEEDQE